jgi:hypothetical protein
VPPLSEQEKAAARGGCQLLGQSLSRIMTSVEENNGGPGEDFVLDAGRARATRSEKGKPPRFGTGKLRDSRSMRWPCGTGYIPEHCPMGYGERW